MSATIKIVSAVLKSVLGDKVGSGLVKDLIGISIEGISEKGINEITDFINDGKSKIDSILSEENLKSIGISEDKTDYVVTEIKDLVSNIDITDEVFRKCQYNSMTLKDFMWSEYVARKNRCNYIECESEIKSGLFAIAEVLTKVMRESEDFSDNMLIQISNAVDDTNVRLQNISEQFLKMNMKNDIREKAIYEKQIFKNNKKEDYIINWKSRLFLHKGNYERSLTLEDTFIIPSFMLYEKKESIGFNDNETLDSFINKFVNFDQTSTMLIVGAPGIGKSSIISWIANKYKKNDEVIILRFRDWKKGDLENGLLYAICKSLGCEIENLENKILVLDGLDEMKALDIRGGVMGEFYKEIKDLNNYKCIITSRPGYISSFYFENVLSIQNFDIDKIKVFYEKITGKKLRRIKHFESNREVLGIPVILYMAIMSNVDMDKNLSIPELYNRIFAEKGGIFDKFFNGEVEYSKGAQLLRDPENIQKYLKFLREIAFTMYEKGDLVLLNSEYHVPQLMFGGKYISILEFPIKHLFEGMDNNIEFIHKSIYEYFLAEYFYQVIYSTINNVTSSQELAYILGSWMCMGKKISPEIYDFLKYKISYKLDSKFYIFQQAFQLMLQDGMSYYTKEIHKNIIENEKRIFINMLKFLHLWENCYIEYNKSFYMYLIICKGCDLKLSGIILKETNLSGIELKNVDLSRGDLSRADMKGVDLIGVDLSYANLSNTDFRRADLSEANLSGAKLIKANLSYVDMFGTNLRRADLSYANLCDASLYGASLNETILSYSIWFEDNIKEIFSRLKGAVFSCIIVVNKNGDKRKIHRSELFPDEIYTYKGIPPYIRY